MGIKETVSNIERLIMPVLTENNYQLFHLELVKEGSHWYLRVFIDKEEGITIDDCELVSRKVEKLLDEEDPIEQAYILEISSPGIDRPLKKDVDFEKYKGELIDVKLYKPVYGRKEHQGSLQGIVDGKIVIMADGTELAFEKAAVAVCKLAVVL